MNNPQKRAVAELRQKAPEAWQVFFEYLEAEARAVMDQVLHGGPEEREARVGRAAALDKLIKAIKN